MIFVGVLALVLPSLANAGAEGEKAKYKNVPPSELAKAKISGADPHLPPDVLAKHVGGTLSGMYKLCVAPEGNVSQVYVVSGVEGADGSIVAALKQWTYQPRPDGECTIVRFVWTLNPPDRGRTNK
jgi:hypothetical protein